MPKKRKSLQPLDPSQLWRSYCNSTDILQYGNRVELLVDGRNAYPAMLDAIEKSEYTILMDSYIFNDDSVGRLFSDALAAAASRGVLTYLIVDAVGTMPVHDGFFEKLKQSGVHLLIYRSWAPWRRSFGILRRNHRKVLVVDGYIGFAGGLNIGDEWAAISNGGRGWHDIHVRVEGPSVSELSKPSMSTWHGHGNIFLDPRVFLPKIAKIGDKYVGIISSRERKKRKAIRHAYLHAIKQAKCFIYIANSYFLPDLGFRRALQNAVKRGVDVRVMVPRTGDILSVQLASQALYSRLLRAGIRILLWQDQVLHAKTAAIDGQWATVGSYNIDHRSWAQNLEVNVNVVGEEFSNHLKAVFLEDEKRCIELIYADWKRRPLWLKIVERFFHLFRKWM